MPLRRVRVALCHLRRRMVRYRTDFEWQCAAHGFMQNLGLMNASICELLAQAQ
jgi:hypothetical protein